MRTTLTLDSDVSAQLQAEMRRTGKSLKEVVNEFLRLGFQSRKTARPVKPFKVRPFAVGPPPGLTLDSVEELIEYLEGPLHR